MRSMYSAARPNGSTPWPSTDVPQRVPDVERVGRVDPDLVAEVAAVAGPADGHPCPADLALGDAEVRDVLHLRDEPLEQVARLRGPWNASVPISWLTSSIVHVVPPDPVGEVGEVRLGAT